MMNREQLLQRLEDLNLPKGKYVLIAGGAMVLHGLREETNDVDLSVDYDLFQKILKGKHKFGSIELKPPKYEPAGFKKHEILRILPDVEISFGGKGLISQPPVEINGHPVQSIRDIRAFKTKLNRPKDKRDLEVLAAAIEKEHKANPKEKFEKKKIDFIKRKNVRGGYSWTGNF